MEPIKEAVAKYFSWVMLLHRWERKEPLLRDIQDKVIYELDMVGIVVKLQKCCKVARDAVYHCASSDACCINQNNNAKSSHRLVPCSSRIATKIHHHLPNGCLAVVKVWCARNQYWEHSRMGCARVPRSQLRSLLPRRLDPEWMRGGANAKCAYDSLPPLLLRAHPAF
jgi:hypothetical protein